MNPRNTTMKMLSLAFVGAAFAPSLFAQGEVQELLGDPIKGVNSTDHMRWIDGRTEFDHILTAPEGLGPIFNDSSCGQCHSTPKTGGFSGKVVERAGIAGPPFDPLAALGGSLFQTQSIEPTSGINPLTGQPWQAGDCGETIPGSATVFTQRLTPPAFGAGLISSIDDTQILAIQNNPPSPFVNGIARMVQPVEGGPMRVGKFGWKGGVATMLTFSADASVQEMGLSNRFFPTDNAPNGNAPLLAACDQAADPEDFPDINTGFERIDRQTDFQELLAPPPQTPRTGMTGEAIFNSIGCADCHVGTAFTTNDPNARFATLNGRTIKPYSDFLLHDMGSLGDGIVDGIATEQLMKTSPLWGLWPRAAVALLHDGSATSGTPEQNITTAIQAHAGEAAQSVANFNALSSGQVDQLMAFFRSLGTSDFDIERNNDRDVFDWFFMAHPQGLGNPATLFTGPAVAVTPDDDAAIGDHNQDGAFDMKDYAAFMRSFSGPNF